MEEKIELYKKYRPRKLEDVVGNSEIISSLKTAIETDSVPHTILLSGPSGCGKTTIARILKKHLGCSNVDFQEFNCSDRNGVDFGREIISNMRFKPMSGKCRIWLLDECHQMSTACSNVLLKPFEDTPDHVYFILSTSEPEKLLPAIKTRATHYSVSSLSDRELKQLLIKVAKLEDIKAGEDAIGQIIENCNGSARLALVMLDQIKGLEEDQIKKVVEEIAQRESQTIELSRALINGDGWSKVANIISNLKDNPENVRRAVLGYAARCLLNPRGNERAFLIIRCFEQSFFNSGLAGLAASAYDVVTAKESK